MKKKRIPECNDAYKEALVQKVLDAEVTYEWECVLKDRAKILPTLFVLIAGFSFSYPMRESWIWFCVSGITVVIALATYFLFFADKDYLCQITPYGIRSYETERVPEACYKFMRGSAYVGIVVCVVAVIFVGPMAFVGAGGSALMVFQMRNFRKNTETQIMPFTELADYQYMSDEPSYGNNITHYWYNNPDYISDEDENRNNLKNFHWMSIYCIPEQHKEIHAVMTQYINAKPRKIEQESAVTE